MHCQETHEKMLNQNYSEVQCHTGRKAIIKKSTNNKWSVGPEKRKSSHTVAGNIKIGIAIMETVWRFLKKLKKELPYDPAIPSMPEHISGEN